MSDGSWTCPRMVAPFRCASRFAAFAALSPVADATFSPSGSATRWQPDLLGAHREPATVEAWLSHHPEVRVISRDRGGGYGQAATRAAPQAVQIADRWPLMENASAAFLEAVRRSMQPIRMALGSTAIDPALLTHAERLQHEGYLRREEAHGTIRTPAKAGTPIKEIVRRTGRSRKLVRDIVRGGGGDVFRSRSNVLEPHLAWLDAEWSAGCHNGAELWRRLQTKAGFRGSLRVIAEWATRRRRAESVGCETLRKPPPARVLSRLLLSERDHLTRGDAITVARIERGVPALVLARDLVERFHRMVRDRDPTALPAWITDAAGSVLASFGKGRRPHALASGRRGPLTLTST
jgi:transposase